MASSDDQSRRVNGVYYTPRELSLRLVEPFEKDMVPKSILDPACGDGSLLSAAKEVFSSGDRGRKLNLYGCDVVPDLRELRRLHPKKYLGWGLS